MAFPSTLAHDDVVRELVRLYGPKTFLHVGALTLRTLEAALVFKSINRMVLCEPDEETQQALNGVIKSYQYAGEVEWFFGHPQEMFNGNIFIQPFDMVVVDGETAEETRLANLISCWKLCKSVLVVDRIKIPSVQKAFGRYMCTVNGQSELSLSRFTGGDGTMVVAR